MAHCVPPVVVAVVLVAAVSACVAVGAFVSRRRTDTALVGAGSQGARCVAVGSPEHQRARLDWLDLMAAQAAAAGHMLMVGPDDAHAWAPAREVESHVQLWMHPTELVPLDDIRIRRRRGDGTR